MGLGAHRHRQHGEFRAGDARIFLPVEADGMLLHRHVRGDPAMDLVEDALADVNAVLIFPKSAEVKCSITAVAASSASSRAWS